MLRTCSVRELKRFEEFVLSPFHNKNENVIKLLEAIRKFYPEFEESHLQWEKIFKKVVPNEPLDEQRLRYIMTDLTKLLEEFFIYLEFDKVEVYRRHKLLMSYDKRDLPKYFTQTYNEIQEYQRKSNFRDVDYYFYQHLVEEDAYLHQLNNDSRTTGDSLQQAIDNLDYYYLSNKLRFCCVIFNRQDVLQVKYSNRLYNEILTILKQGEYLDIPAIRIYYQILMTFIEPENEEHYELLTSQLLEHSSKFTKEESKDMYVFALNYCIKKLNSGKLNHLQELLKLYKTLLEKEIIINKGELSPSDFKNIVTTGLRSSDFEWVEKFINQYKDLLPKDIRTNTYHYTMAFLYYYKKEFSQALKLLKSSDFEDIYFQLDARSLLLRTYFELKEDEPFFSLTDAFSTYLKRNKLISEYQRDAYLNFVKYTKKIMQLKNGTVKFNKEELISELQTVQPVASLQWLLEKIG